MTDRRGALRGRTVVETSPEGLRDSFRALIDAGHRLALVAAHHDGADAPGGEAVRVVYVLVAGPPDARVELHVRLDPARPAVPSLADLSFPASRFEREMHDLFGVEPVGHPRPARLVLHQHWPEGWHPMRADAGPAPAFGDESRAYPFVTVEGPGVYEIPVGPVHAGIIEPGHFRFSVVGETILDMKARLWFVHKGIEALFQGRDVLGGVELAERISGDTAVAHTLAYSLAVEDACGFEVGSHAQRLRAVLLELERLHNHVADTGALCNDVGFGVVHAHAQRIREQLLRLNKEVTGHRLLRGGVFPGGAAVQTLPDIEALEAIRADFQDLVGIALANTTVVDRFTGTAVLTRDQAAEIGTLGYVARASGVGLDARRAHPFADLYDDLDVPVREEGDVLARFAVRVAEFHASVGLLGRLLGEVGPGADGAGVPVPEGPRRHGVGLVEGWRGTVAHRVEISGDGRLSRVKVVDPSFFNWPALPVALADTIVPDFPLANKSFNLSYAGNDL
jgi:Ni,Fe-hydrogenase III large subunit/Ni,Fe-hydrogenase III component G